MTNCLWCGEITRTKSMNSQWRWTKSAYLIEKLDITLNDQIKSLVNSKARFSMLLSEARSNLAAHREEVKAKARTEDWKRATLQRWRNAASVFKSSSECPGDQIVDCDLDAWVGKQCTLDSCPEIPDASEVSCGRWQQIYRKVVVAPDAGGLSCPDLSRSKKCNQKKCPVDCIMSEWLVHCEGGVRSYTRSLLTKPKNGGLSCNINVETGLQQNVMRPWLHSSSLDSLDTLFSCMPWWFTVACQARVDSLEPSGPLKEK